MAVTSGTSQRELGRSAAVSAKDPCAVVLFYGEPANGGPAMSWRSMAGAR